MIVLIPSYEPTEKMLTLISGIQAQTDYDLLIIDDGSGEPFQELFERAEELGCTVLHHRNNKGKGAALKTGFEYLLSTGRTDKVVCADSDGQHHLDDIIRVAESINEEKKEMVLGVREFEGRVPLKSRLGNTLTAFFFKRITQTSIKDTQTGLRGYSHLMLPWLCSVEGDRFEYELNLLLQAKQSQVSTQQISIATIYDNNNKGTHFRPIHDSIRVFLPLLKFCGSSLSSGLLDFVLLFLFQGLTGSLFWSVAFARLISSLFNYSINKILVFKANQTSQRQSAPKYFGLVLMIMILNYSLLALLTQGMGVPDVAAKLLTEMTLFTLSYIVQKLFIFGHVKFRHSTPNSRKPFVITNH
jgi:glycosyltransferase involved in cell wall biosynthesis